MSTNTIATMRRQLAALVARNSTSTDIIAEITSLTQALAEITGAVNVKDLGAVGDGLTDDTVAILAAMAASPAGVYLPSGTYLITSSLVIPASNFIMRGDGPGETIIKLGADGINGITAVSKSNIIIEKIEINGGGQVGDIYTGKKNGKGIFIDACIGFAIRDCVVHHCGVIKNGDPGTDAAFGGHGILVSAASGDCGNGTIERCEAHHIAGGGMAAGDGIFIYSGNANVAIITHDVTVSDCQASYCGRHTFTVAGGDGGNSIPLRITLRDCRGSNAALDGLDIEQGSQVVVQNCRFVNSGNDQTYYNPAVLYGAAYELLSGISVGQLSDNVHVRGCVFSGCYYGLHVTANLGLRVADCLFTDSTIADLKTGAANNPIGGQYTGCVFNTTGKPFTCGYQPIDYGKPTVWRGCSFASRLDIPESYHVNFDACTFLAGVRTSTTGVVAPKFSRCLFMDYGAAALFTQSATVHQVKNMIFDSCEFIGGGNATAGIEMLWRGSLGCVVKNCRFVGINGPAVYQQNGNAEAAWAAITDNYFDGCVDGVKLQLAAYGASIVGNSFVNMTGWCILFGDLAAGGEAYDCIISGNRSLGNNTNGLKVGVSTGTWDRFVIKGNNFHQATGTKWALGAGNAAGYVTENVTA